MDHYWFFYWLGIINLGSGIVFAYDKFAAIKQRRRVPEKTLHFIEILGGVFVNVVLMYAIRHKNRKFSYWMPTWLIATGWVVAFLFFKQTISF